MDGFPSGQRGQTVNLLQIASVVRIHLHPFALMSSMEQCLARKSMQSSITQCVRWCGGIGRRKGLKIPRGQPRAGSSPATSIGFKVWETLILSVFPVFFSTKFLLKYRVETCRPHKYWVFWSDTVSKRCFFCHDFEYNTKGGKRKFRKHVLCCL